MSLATVSSRASPAPWTLCCPALGRRPSHSSSDSGHNAWVSNSERAFSTLIFCWTFHARCRRRWVFDSMPISVPASSNLLTSRSASPYSLFGSTQSQFYSFCTNNLMSLTSLPYISNMLQLASLHTPSIVSLGTPYVQTQKMG